MGPSGSGKTTLLHCIAGKLAASSGSIFLNSTSTVDPRSIKKSVGFVPQDDVMLRTLTVEEIILHRREPSFNRNHLSPITNHQPPITNQHV
jgi:ABC-type multidrug transport system ATPase subunit